jgi:tRNA-2-methylthio-N6-dimethylallyladenosine synthase
MSDRFHIKTYGCQMNVHDSEKLSNLLYHAGFEAGASEDEADLLVINTCSIRDKAENQLYSDLGKLGQWKAGRPGRVLGVGGCVAQQVGDALLARFPQLDFVFGTHNLRLVPSMVASARGGERRADTEESRSQDRFDLPERHPGLSAPRAGRAFVTVMEGCDMFCSFCIVPTTRGREISRPAAGILEEARQLVDLGAREITLLGQTVNAYGRHDLKRDRAAQAGTMAFADLLARLDEIPGLERIRYTSPHPLFFDDALISAHAELASVCPHVHLPMQSGSNRILEAMRRRYDRDRFLEICAALRHAVPDIAITSDIIVAFPAETEADFEDTLSLVQEAGLVDSYSFKYSPRPDTGAAELPGRVDPAVAQRRLTALQSVQRELTISYHRSRVGQTTRVLVEGESRRGGGQLCGRDPYHRVVNLSGFSDREAPAPGDLIAVDVVEVTPHSLIAAPTGTACAETAASSGNADRIDTLTVKLPTRSADEAIAGRARSEAGATPQQSD